VEHAPAGRVSAIANQEPGALERYGLSAAEVEASLWALEPGGRRLAGPRAVAAIGRAMGGGWSILGRLWLLPGAGPLYRLIARSRVRLSQTWSDPPPFG
jgi:predicted DCC family thiol-disulfide oxidoreductase YuxK